MGGLRKVLGGLMEVLGALMDVQMIRGGFDISRAV